MSLVIPSTTGGNSNIAIAQREIIQLEDEIENIIVGTLADRDDTVRIYPAAVNYGFKTHLGNNIELIEGSLRISDKSQKIQTWLEENNAPLICTFTMAPSRIYIGLSLSITFPVEAYIELTKPMHDSCVSLIIQPIRGVVPTFLCYPYRPGGGTPIFEELLTSYTLTFSLLSTV